MASIPSHSENTIPWIEKYRPTNFNEIVLDKTNRKLFDNILKKRYFPNLLFYGPPGTGKTTTIINLIKEYNKNLDDDFILEKQESLRYHPKNLSSEKIDNISTEISQNYSNKNIGNIIHLNASDERGIDIIRNQIHQFVKSKTLFVSRCKFVILDEVDYMTKNAQQALKYLLQTCNENVSFCLICNYISKIDNALKEEFMCIRFNQLPQIEIFNFIKKIIITEDLTFSDEDIVILYELYNSDIRSMINFIQLNQNFDLLKNNIIHSSIWKTIQNMLYDSTISIIEIRDYIYTISIKYNIDKKQIIQCYCNYVIRESTNKLLSREQLLKFSDMLNVIANLLHNKEHNIGEHVILSFIIGFRDSLI